MIYNRGWDKGLFLIVVSMLRLARRTSIAKTAQEAIARLQL
jgi:hypothetical protein